MNMTYFVTFRIADKMVGGKSYDERREMLIDNVYSKNAPFWDETTSFFIIGSKLTTFKFAEQAFRGLSAKDDLVVVFDPKDMSMAYFGPVKHPDVLKSFFGSWKKLP